MDTLETMLSSFGGNQTQTLVRDSVQSLLRDSSYDDCLLLPLVLLGSVYVYNRGSLLPKRDPFHYKWFEKPQEGLNASAAAVKATRNIADKIAETNADLVVFWGSQSGVAEGLAHRLARELARRFRLVPLVADLDDYDPETIATIPDTKIAVFVMSTYGEGEPSDNARDFVAWTTSGSGIKMPSLKFAAFGCGNKNYRFYNKVIDDAAAALTAAGAVPLLPGPGRGDEAARSTDEDFGEWKEQLVAALVARVGLEAQTAAGYEPSVDVVEVEASKGEVQTGTPLGRNRKGRALSTIVAAPLSARHDVASYSDQTRSCVHVEIDLAGHRHIKYRTGDHVAVWPENPEAEVQSLLGVLGLESKKDTAVQVSSREGGDGLCVPRLTTIDALLRHYLEIGSVVSREAVLSLAEFAPSEAIKAFLLAIGRDKQSHASYVQSNHVTLSRLLQSSLDRDRAAAAWPLPLSFVIDALPAMKPRLYSIASSPALSPRRVALTVSVKPAVIGSGDGQSLVPGLASTYLSRVPLPQQQSCSWPVHMEIRASSFRLPAALSVPVIMVAAGTGIAPFRAFIQERAHVARLGKDVGCMLLFFGCQTEDDFLYKDALAELQAGALKGKLDILAAFSRSGSSRGYVDKAVQTRAETGELGRLLFDEDAAVYICGAASMATSIRGVVSGVVKQARGCSDVEAEDWRQERKKSKRWFEDVWG